MTATLYAAEFYQNRRLQTVHAAEKVFAALPTKLERASVIDVGCGTGTWLGAALAAGSTLAHGIEGNWVTQAMLDDPRIVLQSRDLEQRLSGPRVDLAMSLEVAEHLTPARAQTFIADLVALAPAVLFGAAIPGQGGVGHLNEQWPSFWAGLFAAHGYKPLDIVRPAIWTDETIPVWYRQNIVLYCDQVTLDQLDLAPDVPGVLDKVHPSLWARANRELIHAQALPESAILARQMEQAQQQQ